MSSPPVALHRATLRAGPRVLGPLCLGPCRSSTRHAGPKGPTSESLVAKAGASESAADVDALYQAKQPAGGSRLATAGRRGEVAHAAGAQERSGGAGGARVWRRLGRRSEGCCDVSAPGVIHGCLRHTAARFWLAARRHCRVPDRRGTGTGGLLLGCRRLWALRLLHSHLAKLRVCASKIACLSGGPELF